MFTYLYLSMLSPSTKRKWAFALLEVLAIVMLVIGMLWLQSPQWDYERAQEEAQAALEERFEDVGLRTVAQTLKFRANACLEHEMVSAIKTKSPFDRRWFWESSTTNRDAAKKIWQNCMEAEIYANRIGDPGRAETETFLNALAL